MPRGAVKILMGTPSFHHSPLWGPKKAPKRVQHVPRAGRSSQEGTESRGREGSPGMPVFCHRAATTAVTKHEALAARGSLINRRAGGEQRAAQPMRSHGRGTSSATSPRSLLASLTKTRALWGPTGQGSALQAVQTWLV